MLKELSVLQLLKFLSRLFDHAAKKLDNKAKVNFKVYDITTWETNNYNSHIAKISRSKGNQTMKFGQ